MDSFDGLRTKGVNLASERELEAVVVVSRWTPLRGFITDGIPRLDELQTLRPREVGTLPSVPMVIRNEAFTNVSSMPNSSKLDFLIAQ